MAPPRAIDRWTDAAAAALAAIADWRQTHRHATWDEIEAAVDTHLDMLRAHVLTDAVTASPLATCAGWRERPRCPACDGRLQANGQHTREVVTQRGGVIALRRTHGWCPRCRAGFFPPGPGVGARPRTVGAAAGGDDRAGGDATAL